MSSTTQPQPPPPQPNDTKPKSMDYRRHVLQNRLTEDQSKHTYVSPSDDIMSPASQKLNAYKGKHFMKAKPQALFVKSDAKRPDAVQGDNPFADKENDVEGRTEETQP